MWYTVLLLIITLVEIGNGQSLSDLNGEIREYFETGSYKSFHSKWLKYKNAMENSVESAMKTMNGERKMNVIIKKNHSPIQLTGGFYVTDNIVALLLSNLALRDLSYIEMPDVKIALAGNALRFEGDLTKMFIDVEYLLFRNKSDILFSGVPQDPYKYSPFSFQQVEHSGSLTIIAEGCTLNGIAIAKLNGQKVALGHETLRVRGCKFTIEISSPGSGQPPVIAPYFTDYQKRQLERLLTKPIQSDVYPRLQGAIFSIINTTSLFGSDLRSLQESQGIIFKKTRNYLSNIIQKINTITTEDNSGTIPIKGLAIVWEEMLNGNKERSSLVIDSVILSNLDSIYSSYNGGPYKLMTRKVADQLRFSSLQVRGRITVHNSSRTVSYKLGAELLDVAVDMVIDLEGQFKERASFEFLGWRALEYSSHDILYLVNGNLVPDLLIKAYLNSLLPDIIQKYLEDIFAKAENYKPKDNSKEIIDTSIEECIKKLREAGIPVGNEVVNPGTKLDHNVGTSSNGVQALTHETNDKVELYNDKYAITGLSDNEGNAKMAGFKKDKSYLFDQKYVISGLSDDSN